MGRDEYEHHKKDERIAELKSELADARATIEALESRLAWRQTLERAQKGLRDAELERELAELRFAADTAVTAWAAVSAVNPGLETAMQILDGLLDAAREGEK